MARSRVRVSGRSPHFFKVFFPHLSSEHLKIPPKFRKHMDGEKSHTVSLKGPSERTWNVDLVKNLDGLLFGNGWNEFVTDHSLALGDFLVFRYDGESQFTVFLFDKTACEKEAAFTATPVLDMNRGGESVGVEDSKPLVVARNRGVHFTQKRKRGIDECVKLGGPLQKKRSKVETNNPQDGSTVRKSKSNPHCTKAVNSLNSQSLATHSPPNSNKARRCCPRKENQTVCKPSVCKSLDGNPKLKTQSGRVAKASSRRTTLKTQSSIQESNNSSKTSALILSHNKSSQMPQHVEVVKEQRKHGFISRRRPVTEKELDKTRAMAQSFHSEHPFSLVEMKEAYVYVRFFLYMPLSFARKNLPHEKREITLWDPDGKSWKVTYIYYGDRGGLSGGWQKFSYSHNLEIGDVCVFELIKKYHLRVHFFRVVKKIVPLLRYWEA